MLHDRAEGAAPFILAIGGTTRMDSSGEKLLRICAGAAEKFGAEIGLVTGPELIMPMYAPDQAERSPAAKRLVALMRKADAFIIASPGYHGSVSGLVKNALDYSEDLRDDPRPYFDGCAVGCIATANGWQASVSTLGTLRNVVHALRGWPSPLGVAVNSSQTKFDADGRCDDAGVTCQLTMLAEQIVNHARRHNFRLPDEHCRVPEYVD